jgi:hypothetical protein
MDIGYGFSEDGQLYSPALARAVILEKNSGYPGILVGERFRDYLVALLSGTGDDEDRRLIEKVLRVLQENPNKKYPGTYVLDYLGANSRRDFVAALPPARVVRILKFALDSLGEAEAQEESKEKKKVISYYRRLIKYIEDRLSIWGITIPSKGSARFLAICKKDLPKPRR